MLYDHARGLGEGFHALPRRVGVGNIVERELLALQLCERCDGAGDLRFVTIERRGLMRVLAVTQVLDLGRLPVPAFGKGPHGARRIARSQVIADRAVVGGRMREGLLGEPEPRRRRQHRAVGAKLFEQRRIIAGVDNDPDVRVILRRGADHGWPADVDVLDRLVQRAAGFRHRFAKRIEIDDDEVDRRNAVLGERLPVRRQVASRQDAAVHFRVQGLDAAVEHLRKTGVRSDLRDRQPRIGERARRAPGRKQAHAQRMQPAREVDQPGLVRNRQQRLVNWCRH